MVNIKGHPALLSLFSQRVKKISKEGDHYMALCPFHDDHHPSLNIGKDEKREWVYMCFACGASGDVIKFVQEIDKIPFTSAKKLIEDSTGGDWEESKKLAEETFQKLEIESALPKVEIPVEKYVKFEIALYESKEAQEWLFRERGITYETAKAMRFGFCQSLDSVTTKYDREALKDIVDKGWITFAAIEGDKVLCIEARSIVTKETRIRTGMSNKVLFGVNDISWDDPIYVTEGKFDAAIFKQAGFRSVSLPNASANLTPQMRDYLMSASVVILAGDNDGGAGTNKMVKLWNELQERTFRLVWPDGKKDANQVFLETCGRDIEKFKKMVDQLTLDSYSKPLPGVQSIQDILLHDDSTSSGNREDRFLFPWNPVDKMVNFLPGSVMYLSATETSMGKTQFSLQMTLHGARKRDEVVLNYQCEMSNPEIAEIVTSQMLAKDRGDITKEDRLEAAKKLRGVQYYIGNNPNLNSMTSVLDLIEAGVRRVGATVVVLDHIHFICREEGDEIKAQSQAMQRIKRLAQKYGLKFIVVGQPRKPSQKNQGKSIGIYDAKGSESIVSDSDVVLLLHRDKVKVVTEDTKDPLVPETEIRCMKGRNRGKGSAFAKLMFLGKICTFMEITPVEEPLPIDNSFDF